MPYQGAELQAYCCSKWAKENGYLYDPNGDAFISVANGYEVAVPLADDDGDVLVTDYGANGLKIEKRKTSMPKPYGKRKRCKTAEEAITEFKSPPDNKTSCKCKVADTAVQENITETTPCNCTHHDEADTSADNIVIQDTPVNCPDIPDYRYAGDYKLVTGEDGKKHRMRVGGDDAGVVDGLCKDYETARSGFKKQMDKCLKSCDFDKSCAFTLTTYVKQSFADIQKAVQALSKKEKGFLFNEYANLKCICPFLEPYADGGWHVHMILCFYDEIPDNLYEKILKEWKKHIIVPTETYKLDEYLVEMREFYNAGEFVKYLDYLNPVSKKKRDRLKFYPYKRRARENYGDLKEPKRVIMPASEAKKLTEREHIALRHEIKIVNASSTIRSGKEDLKFHQFTYYFSIDEVLWNAILENRESENNDYSGIETAPPLTDLQPHFSITVFTKDGKELGKRMTEVDFDYDIEKAIKLADFYERNSKLFGGVEVIREGIPIQQAVSMA